ncbi:tRNA ligase [Turnera subulata]|uniref:DNA ligase n=1 Tax=Turnera subulata TaxID=218843 RepID=A0A9Q0F6H1_9ROSI|nr:tRNA ligase [Turnera subulata]
MYLTFRPCSSSSTYLCCVSSKTTKLFSVFSSRFLSSSSSKSAFPPKPPPTPPSLSVSSSNPKNPRKTTPAASMSSSGPPPPPSAFDALMSGARKAAAAKKKSQPPPQSSSTPPKKRKAPPAETETPAQDSPKLGPGNPKNREDRGNPKESTAGADRLAELKSKIKRLKEKPHAFRPEEMATWENGESVPFIFVSLACDLIDAEKGRIVITDIVCNMLRTVMYTTPQDLVSVVHLLANKVASPQEGIELGVGDFVLVKALAESFGKMEKEVKKLYKEMGDLGSVAKASRSSQLTMRKPRPLTIAKVFDTFRLIAKESGKDSQEKKKNHIKGLLVAATDSEPLYIVRLLQSKLRIGVAEQTLLAALGQAAVYNEKHSTPPSNTQSPLEDAAKIVKQVFSVLPLYDRIVHALLNDGVWKLPKTCGFTPGIPVGPMLAKPAKDVSEIVNKFQDTVFTCEYKYDGERAQIHYMEDGSVEIYSRNAERTTGKYPDIVSAISRIKKSSVSSFVLDAEVVAYDRDKKKILPFQVLSTRARKNVVENDVKIDVCVFAFDVLYLNGEQLFQEELKTRRERLHESFQEEPGIFQFATAITSNDVEEIQNFLDAAVDASCEGLIIKTLNKDATYEPSKRSNNWVKLKKDYMDSFGDSLDLVPIGGFHGRGKRTGTYGAFLLACYDSNNDEYQSICKIGTGFTEAMLEERSASLRSKVIDKPKAYYRYGGDIPDVWFEPTEVWEVKAADLTISPRHPAAIGEVDPDKGISLRFPRLLRVREDKSPEQASSSQQVADMYNAQKNNQSKKQDSNKQDDQHNNEDDCGENL